MGVEPVLVADGRVQNQLQLSFSHAVDGRAKPRIQTNTVNSVMHRPIQT